MYKCHSPEVERVKLNGFLISIRLMELEQERAESLKKCLKIAQDVLLSVLHSFF